MKNKRGMEIAEIVKIVIIIFFLVVASAMIGILIKGKGGESFAAIKKLLRFGRV